MELYIVLLPNKNHYILYIFTVQEIINQDYYFYWDSCVPVCCVSGMDVISPVSCVEVVVAALIGVSGTKVNLCSWSGWSCTLCCSPTKITELSESVLVEDILVEFQKSVVSGRNYKREGMEVRAAVEVTWLVL